MRGIRFESLEAAAALLMVICYSIYRKLFLEKNKTTTSYARIFPIIFSESLLSETYNFIASFRILILNLIIWLVRALSLIKTSILTYLPFI